MRHRRRRHRYLPRGEGLRIWGGGVGQGRPRPAWRFGVWGFGRMEEGRFGFQEGLEPRVEGSGWRFKEGVRRVGEGKEGTWV